MALARPSGTRKGTAVESDKEQMGPETEKGQPSPFPYFISVLGKPAVYNARGCALPRREVRHLKSVTDWLEV